MLLPTWPWAVRWFFGFGYGQVNVILDGASSLMVFPEKHPHKEAMKDSQSGQVVCFRSRLSSTPKKSSRAVSFVLLCMPLPSAVFWDSMACCCSDGVEVTFLVH